MYQKHIFFGSIISLKALKKHYPGFRGCQWHEANLQTQNYRDKALLLHKSLLTSVVEETLLACIQACSHISQVCVQICIKIILLAFKIFNNGRNTSIPIEIKMSFSIAIWNGKLLCFAAQLHVESWYFWCCPLADQATGLNAYCSLLITFQYCVLWYPTEQRHPISERSPQLVQYVCQEIEKLWLSLPTPAVTPYLQCDAAVVHMLPTTMFAERMPIFRQTSL